jgi:Ca2+/Na+ antiporter
MSLSERDRQVLAELEQDLGKPSAVTRLYLLTQASRAAWHGLLLPAVAFAVGAGLLAAGAVVGAVGGELMIVAGITAISYAAYAAAIAWPTPHRTRKRA